MTDAVAHSENSGRRTCNPTATAAARPASIFAVSTWCGKEAGSPWSVEQWLASIGDAVPGDKVPVLLVPVDTENRGNDLVTLRRRDLEDLCGLLEGPE